MSDAARIAELEAETLRLREALAFYRNEWRWHEEWRITRFATPAERKATGENMHREVVAAFYVPSEALTADAGTLARAVLHQRTRAKAGA